MKSLTNIRKVAGADVTPLPNRGADVRILLSPKNVQTTSGLLVTITIEPGEHVREHYHPYSEELVYVVRGEMTVRLDGNRHQVRAGEAFVIPTKVRHRMENAGDDQVFVVVHLSPLAPRPDLGHVDTEDLP
jgi:putative monooxygenase